jgi:hypothetical protein
MHADTKRMLALAFERVISDTSVVDRCLHVLPWLGEEQVRQRLVQAQGLLMMDADSRALADAGDELPSNIASEDAAVLALLTRSHAIAIDYGRAFATINDEKRALASMEMLVVATELCAPLAIQVAAACGLRILTNNLPQLSNVEAQDA